MKIIIETIEHAKQRYPTVGDWYFADENGIPKEGDLATDTMVIRVSNLGNWKEELLVAVHELVEVAVAQARGVTVAEVDAFDKEFEAVRKAKLEKAQSEPEKDLLLIDEPGDDPECPIRLEHSLATGVERILASALAVNWKLYESKVEHL